MARDEDLTDATTASDSGTWFADCSAWFAKTAEDCVRVGAAMADRWPCAHREHTPNTSQRDQHPPASNPDAAIPVPSSQPTTTLAAVS